MLKSIFNLIQIVPQNKFDCFGKKYLNNWTLLFFSTIKPQNIHVPRQRLYVEIGNIHANFFSHRVSWKVIAIKFINMPSATNMATKTTSPICE